MLLGPKPGRDAAVIVGLAAAMGLLPALAVAAPTEPSTLVHPLAEAQDCRYCHEYPNDTAQQSDAPYAAFITWQGSMMAYASRDPVFWAAVALASQDEPDETTDCVRCHVPRAFLEGRGDVIALSELTTPDLNGVECELCHRMLEDVGTPRGNARYAIDDVDVGEGVPRRGPWDYTDGVSAPDPVGTHETVADPFTGSSALCGTCHDVTTGRDRVDDDGNAMGMSFNEQRTYSEWLGSAFAVPGADFRSCADCHMRAIDDKAGCQLYSEAGTLHATGGRRHDLLGANRFMLEIARSDFGEDAGEGFWNLSIAQIDEFLPTSATLEATGPASVSLAEGLSDLQVTVTNETGHKLPSGYSEGRVMWIEVVATYGDQVVWSSGAWDQDAGTIEDDAQVRRYEGIAENYATGTQNHLLQNDHWVVDSRIPPRGLQPDPQTDPVGDRFTLQGDGSWPHFDATSYAFEARPDIVDATPDDDGDDVLTVTVRLRYLINTPDYIQQLVDDNATNDAGTTVATMFDDAGGVTPVDLAPEQVLTIPITAFGDVSDTDGTAGSTSTTGPGTSTTAPGTTDPGTTTDASAGTDTEGPAQDGDEGGCGCRTEGAPSTRGWAWLLLLPLLRRPRTRRR